MIAATANEAPHVLDGLLYHQSSLVISYSLINWTNSKANNSRASVDLAGLSDSQCAIRDQLAIGAPNDHDEAGLKWLARQIRKKQLIVKLFLRHTLRAKLYLLFRSDAIDPED